MRLVFCLWLSLLVAGAAQAAGGRVYKVLPQYLDEKGLESRSPSLYDRDAYQAFLRRNPGKRSGVRFAVQWKGSDTNTLTLRVEMRGEAQGAQPKSTRLEQTVQQHGWFSHWAMLSLKGDDYKKFGDVTAWRVTLWDGDQLVDEQKSFLW